MIVADATNIQMMVLWVKVVERLHENSDIAFPDYEGETLKHIERRINTAANALGHNLPTATNLRKELEISNKRQEGPLREAVSRALSHSLGTAQQYYQAPTLQDAYGAYASMQSIMGGKTPACEQGVNRKRKQAEEVGRSPSPTSTPLTKRAARPSPSPEAPSSSKQAIITPTGPPPRRRYSKREVEVLEEYFQTHISSNKIPISTECRDFLNMHPEMYKGRKPKDIYDKCRNICGRP